MSGALVLAGAGILVAALLAIRLIRLRRRLALVARAEHELRSPLTALALAAERARRTGASGWLVDSIDTQIDRARAGLGDLAAARSGLAAESRHDPKTGLGDSPPPLAELVRRSVSAYDAMGRERGGVRLEWRAGTRGPTLDSGRVAQALGNLLANAVEHGAGPVVVRGTSRPGAVRVEVAPDLERRPLPSARGHGLAVAAAAARSAGGGLTVAPDPAGGLAFAVDLPDER